MAVEKMSGIDDPKKVEFVSKVNEVTKGRAVNILTPQEKDALIFLILRHLGIPVPK